GGLLDLAMIGRHCRRLGVALVLDITQSAGVLPFDANEVQPDFAVAAGYKWLMGPYSLG
ncbi:MAG: aminotransferase class V-fold PLP-dependent enzyme, partial [Burkholderiales bacterium]|nr:aminotransferase class V-fold PLP-dependent enzyme [Burkholderiales bacterium]